MAQDRVIRVRVDSRDAQRQLQRLNNTVGGTNTQLGTAGRSASRFSSMIGRAGLVASVALATKGLIGLGEAFQKYETLIKASTKSSEEFEAVSKELFKTSLETGTSLESNANVFQRLNNR